MTKLQQSDWLRGVISLIAMMEKNTKMAFQYRGGGIALVLSCI